MYNPLDKKRASLVAAVIGCLFLINLAAADDDDRHGHTGLRAKLDNLEQQVGQNTEAIAINAGNIADNFSASAANASDITGLDARITELEEAASGTERAFVDVDCLANPDALLQPPINGSFPDDTTYNITGACNGPLYVTEDRVYFIGVEPGAAIVLPGHLADPSNGAVFGDGAHDLRIRNLLIDASAWATGALANDTGAAGIYARNAYVRVIDTRIFGGEIGINPFRNAIIDLQGLVEITGFVNNALGVGDHSVLVARGPVAISTGVIDGSELVAVDVYRGGVVDFRGGVVINLPPENEPGEFFPTAIGAVNQSHVRIRHDPMNDIQRLIAIDSNSSAHIEGAFIDLLDVGDNSTVTLNLVSIDGDVILENGSNASFHSVSQSGGYIEVESGSTLEMEESQQAGGGLVISRTSHASVGSSTIAELAVLGVASLEFGGGQFGGAVIQAGAVASFFNASALGDIRLFPPSHLIYKQEEGLGLLNGNTVYLCGNTSSVIDPVIAATGVISDDCLGNPFD